MFLMCLASCATSSFEIPGRNLYVQNGREGQAVRLFHTDGVGFRLTTGSQEFDIQSYNVRGLPEGITSEQLNKDDLYFRLNQNGQNSVLTANARLRGGMHRRHPWPRPVPNPVGGGHPILDGLVTGVIWIPTLINATVSVVDWFRGPAANVRTAVDTCMISPVPQNIIMIANLNLQELEGALSYLNREYVQHPNTNAVNTLRNTITTRIAALRPAPNRAG